MPLSEQSLYPLTATSVQLPYFHDRPLQYIATRYAPISPLASDYSGRISCTLLFAGGVSLNQETWLPAIKHLYSLTSGPTSPIIIHSAWTIERPNHGDAGLLNEPELKQRYTVVFRGLQYAAAIRAFLASYALSAHERANLIGIGHSGGAGSLVQALDSETQGFPLRRLILIESMYDDTSAFPKSAGIFKAVRLSNSRRQSSWGSKDEAMRWLKAHAPWKGFHPDVLHIISETYFRPDPENPGRITAKTTVEQETASFTDDGTQFEALPYLRTFFHAIPTHLINGAVQDAWPSASYKDIERNIDQDRATLASVTTIQGAGHYVQAQKPEELAIEIYDILRARGLAGPTYSRL